MAQKIIFIPENKAIKTPLLLANTILFILLIIFSFPLNSLASDEKEVLNILISNNLLGETEPCG